MRRPPPLSGILHFPATGGIALFAVATSIAVFMGRDISQLDMTIMAFRGEPWRLLTSTLPHGGVFHLLFNVYWLWVFGSYVEKEFGTVTMLGMFVIFGAGSSAAEYALLEGGIGLSGVGYGLFGFLWQLSKHSPRYRDAMDKQTAYLFIGWFFLCIVLTATDVWHIANVAHGYGLLLGAFWGRAVSGRDWPRRLAFGGGMIALMVLAVLAAALWRPVINLSPNAGQDAAYLGYVAIEKGDYKTGAELYAEALKLNDKKPGWWRNYAISLVKTGQSQKAAEAFMREIALDPASPSVDMLRGLADQPSKHAPTGDMPDEPQRETQGAKPPEQETPTP